MAHLALIASQRHVPRSALSVPEDKLPGTMQRVLDGQKQQARLLLRELLATRGLMLLLMKNRNGSAWTEEEKAELLRQLRALSRLSPYLLFLLLPGSALFLPLYAWWLDRRRQDRDASKG